MPRIDAIGPTARFGIESNSVLVAHMLGQGLKNWIGLELELRMILAGNFHCSLQNRVCDY